MCQVWYVFQALPYENTGQKVGRLEALFTKEGAWMKRIWAPWRMSYVMGPKESRCVFCLGLSEHADLTLYHGNHCIVLMNRYPYTNGHILVAPERHVESLENLSGEQRASIMDVVAASIGILKKVMKPEGFNVGFNLGEVAGAGIEDHLHMHIVPRWEGDANFISVLGETRILSEALNTTFSRLKPDFDILAAGR